MKSTKPVCGYCGERSKWGYYNIDGMKVCDECGDFVRYAESKSRSRIKAVMGASCGNKSPKHLAVEPSLLGKMHDPRNNLGVGGTGIKVDVVISIIGIEHKDVAANLVSTHPRLHRLLEFFYGLFSVFHNRCDGKVLNSQTNSGISSLSGGDIQEAYGDTLARKCLICQGFFWQTCVYQV